MLATGLALYAAALQGVAAIRFELGEATSPAPQFVPVSYYEDGATGARGGCHERGGWDRDQSVSPRDF